MHGGGNFIYLKGCLNLVYEVEGWEVDFYYCKNVSKVLGEYYG